MFIEEIDWMAAEVSMMSQLSVSASHCTEASIVSAKLL